MNVEKTNVAPTVELEAVLSAEANKAQPAKEVKAEPKK